MITKNYGIFNRVTAAKTGTAAISRKFATREEARMWLQAKYPTTVGSARKHGIVNLTTMTPIR